MSVKFKKGTPVKQAVKPIEGTVVRAHIVDGDRVEYFVAYEGADGEQHERSFKEHEIEATGEAPSIEEAQEIAPEDVGDAADVLAKE